MPAFNKHGNTIGISTVERRIIELLADGYTDQEIADELTYNRKSVTTVIHLLAGRAGIRNWTRKGRRRKLVHMYFTGDLFVMDDADQQD